MAGSVIIVEDDPLQAGYIADFVVEAGLAVAGIAADVGEALALAESCEPALIISDVRLRNGESGFEAVRKIRSYWDVPAILVTGYSELLKDIDLPPRTRRLEKPIVRERLMALIATSLQNESEAA